MSEFFNSSIDQSHYAQIQLLQNKITLAHYVINQLINKSRPKLALIYNEIVFIAIIMIYL